MDLGTLTSYIPIDFSSGLAMSKTLLWGLIIGVTISFLIIVIRNKMKYQYYGLAFRRRQDSLDNLPQAMIVQGKAGYFKKKGGKTIFRIKYGLAPWKNIETSQLPDPQYMMGNTVILLQVQKDNFTQAKISVNWEGQTFKLEPIDDSLKYDALLEMKEIDNILDTKKLAPVTVGMIVMGLIIVTGIIVYYFLGKAG